MPRPRITLRAAAALFLERQQLDRPRGRRLTAASLAGLARDTGGLQLDSINVVDRAHHLTLWSRFGPYDRAKLDRLIYRRRVLFEYWAHVACLVATDHFPAWRRAMLDYRRHDKAWGAWLKKHGPTVRLVEAAIRERGPLGSADFEQPPGKRAAGWWNWKPAAHALDYLWMSGVVAPDSRRHFHKRFDLIERVLPGPLALKPLDPAAFRRWHLERSLHAMGAATETDLRMYLTYPRQPVSDRRDQLRHAIRAGEVTEIEVEGQRGTWVSLTRDLPALERAGRRRAPSRGTTFLSPFDSILWHRERVRRLYGFDYRIEVYVPAPRRKFGYYVLPLIHDGHFIGRADVKTHRADGVLEIRAIHFEDWFVAGGPPPAARWGTVDRDQALAGTADAMRSLAAFVGAREVKLGAVTPRSLRSSLRQALTAAEPRTRQRFAAPLAGYSGKPTIDKLGVKPGMRVAVQGLESEKAFLDELAARTSEVTTGRPARDTGMILLRVDSERELAKLAALEKAIRRDGAIWVVWPKGRAHIKEDMVRAAALASGLVDVKVCAFSDTLSALKLVIPVARR